MGEMIKAVCENCDFETETLYYGGGMNDFLYSFGMPAINRETGEFAFLNYFNREELKHEFIFYTDPSMYDSSVNSGIRISNIVESNKFVEVPLRSNGNLCPACKQYTLSFQSGGLWD